MPRLGNVGCIHYTIYDIFFVKHCVPTNTNVDFAEITKNIQVRCRSTRVSQLRVHVCEETFRILIIKIRNKYFWVTQLEISHQKLSFRVRIFSYHITMSQGFGSRTLIEISMMKLKEYGLVKNTIRTQTVCKLVPKFFFNFV